MRLRPPDRSPICRPYDIHMMSIYGVDTAPALLNQSRDLVFVSAGAFNAWLYTRACLRSSYRVLRYWSARGAGNALRQADAKAVPTNRTSRPCIVCKKKGWQTTSRWDKAGKSKMREQVTSGVKTGPSGGACRNVKDGRAKLTAAEQHEIRFPNRDQTMKLASTGVHSFKRQACIRKTSSRVLYELHLLYGARRQTR